MHKSPLQPSWEEQNVISQRRTWGTEKVPSLAQTGQLLSENVS